MPGLDWVAGSLSRRKWGDITDYLSAWWGAPIAGRGGHFYTDRLQWETGGVLLFTAAEDGINADHMTVELSGEVLAQWDPGERIKVLRDLWGLGVGFSRLDLPIDVHGENVRLIHDVRAACERLEHCGVRSWWPLDKYGRGGKLTSCAVYLGQRGGKGRSVCCYDKGLEKGGPVGQWVRWETRFADAHANNAASLLLSADDYERTGQKGGLRESEGVELVAGWLPQYLALSLGVVDFREPQRGQSRELKRRARSVWWRDFIGQVEPVRVRVEGQRAPSLDRFRKWLGRCVWPTVLGLEVSSGHGTSDVLDRLGYHCARVGGAGVVVAQFKREAKSTEVMV